MTNPKALYQDMEKLDSLYTELGWDHDDVLTFKIVKPESGCAFIAVENLTKCMDAWF